MAFDFYRDLEPAFFEKIQNEWALHHCLSVNVPDLDAGFFGHDKDGQPIDCNIYHPKYGYRGFLADSRDIIPSFSECTVYRDDKTGKHVYCRYCLPMLCEHEDGHFTNKDGDEVVKAEVIFGGQKRLAEGEADFAEIFCRELAANGLTDVPATKRDVFVTELREYVTTLIQLHRDNAQYGKGRKIALIELANEFLTYLNKLQVGISPDAGNTAANDDNISAEAKPAFSIEGASAFLEIVNGFFPDTQQVALEALIRKQHKPAETLLFRSNGNRLADAFKQLYEANFITGCQKKDLAQWIAQNFQYQNKGIKSYKLATLESIISNKEGKMPCKKPLLKVVRNDSTGRYTIRQA